MKRSGLNSASFSHRGKLHGSWRCFYPNFHSKMEHGERMKCSACKNKPAPSVELQLVVSLGSVIFAGWACLFGSLRRLGMLLQVHSAMMSVRKICSTPHASSGLLFKCTHCYQSRNVGRAKQNMIFIQMCYFSELNLPFFSPLKVQ